MPIVVGIIVIGMLMSIAGIGAGAWKAFSAGSDRNIGIYKVSSDEFDEADLDRIQKDDRTAPLRAVGGIAEAALSAQTAAAPGAAPNPVGLGFTEGMSLGQYAGQAAEEFAASGGGSGTAAGAQSPAAGAAAADVPAALRRGGVALSTAPGDYFVAWYMVHDGDRYVMTTTVDDYRNPWTTATVFGGSDTSKVKKVPLTNAHWSQAEVWFVVGDNVTSWSDDYGERGVLGGVEYRFDLCQAIPAKYH